MPGPLTARRTTVSAVMAAATWPAVAVAVVCAAWPDGRATAESPRWELGRRLRRFEEAWQAADDGPRAASREAMEQAVTGFFSFRLAAAARSLDDAWYAVRSEPPPGVDERRAVAMAATCTPLVADVEAAAPLRLEFAACYDLVDVPADEAATIPLRLQIRDHTSRVVAERPLVVGETRAEEWAVQVPEGDGTLVVSRGDEVGGGELVRIAVARIPRLAARLAAVREAAAPLPPSTARRSAEAIAALLDGLAAGRQRETDYPAARLLEFAERLVAGGPDPIAAAAREHDVWLTLVHDGGELPVRLRAPAAEGPLPVLVLFHGAGGSENMFFETCGAGRAVTLGLARGWLVVAPRQGFFGLPLDLAGILAAVERHLPVDRTRVYLAGHSMGAAQVTRQVARHPELVTAAAALGGGGPAPRNQAAAAVRWFVAAGGHDFGRSGGRALADRLAALGADVTWREFADVEHMVVVQAALDEMFACFDRAAPRR